MKAYLYYTIKDIKHSGKNVVRKRMKMIKYTGVKRSNMEEVKNGKFKGC